MEPKFVVTLDGYLRIGHVCMHKDLLLPDDVCIGGGFWEVDEAGHQLLLSGKSYDYGKPKWTFIDSKLYVPKMYQGLSIVYEGDVWIEYYNVSEQLNIHYYE